MSVKIVKPQNVSLAIAGIVLAFVGAGCSNDYRTTSTPAAPRPAYRPAVAPATTYRPAIQGKGYLAKPTQKPAIRINTRKR